MMCAIEAGKRGRGVVLLEHAKKPGEKIRISGGGRCNFTNSNCTAENFISANPHFVKSALAQYSSADFLALVERHNIKWHEKTLGQLFCDNRSSDIINMLTSEMEQAGVQLHLNVKINSISKSDDGFTVDTQSGTYNCKSLVVACGGKSIPKMGASAFGYSIGEQFGINIIEARPALVPFTFDSRWLENSRPLSGIAFECEVKAGKKVFREAALFTHRGLSGPAMLQISSYWREGEILEVKFQDRRQLKSQLIDAIKKSGKKEIHTWLATIYPLALAKFLCKQANVSGRLGDMSNLAIDELTHILHCWKIKPAGTEGYRTAEVTLGGIDTNELNSKTMETRKIPGLYFIGEVVDVTGWLGGYNFQWAWSSGWAAGQAL
ncbi:MAG: NAD(P)/FAD-dependent oxidoreductase [Rhizobiaceae bacterium]|nr:NAD(P)/FAD-dependent oxidoreductase [Rhizobiaceae bacterium]